MFVGPDHPWLAYSMTALGKTLIAAHRSAEAIPVLGHALRIRQKGEPVVELIAETHFVPAWARWDADDGRDAALELVGRRATYRAQPQAARHVAEIDAWLAGRKS